jgi:flagellar hook-associated protein 1 FlgK
MYGINVGFEIGKRALLSQQFSLNLTGHNIANVNTPGFTRQQAIMVSTEPLRSASGNFGTGVEVTGIRRLRTLFLDGQYRQESQSLGRWETLSNSWGQIERVYSEPSDTGFSSFMDNFWNSWQDLAANPDSLAARVAVKEQASLVINSMHQLDEQLKDFQQSLDEDIQKTVQYINTIGHQLASLNDSIATAELTGHAANDLRDRRDYLVDELSQYVNVDVLEQSGGSYTVHIGSMALVDGTDVSELRTEVVEQSATVIHTVQFANSSARPEITDGKLAGLLEARDEVVPERVNELDELAVALVENINNLHRQGYGVVRRGYDRRI